MCSIIVRPAEQNDMCILQEMPSYTIERPGFASEARILIAESDGEVVGAVTVSKRDISFISGKWKKGNEQLLNDLLQKVTGIWISRLYVFPEHRQKGVATKLLEEAVSYLRKRGDTTVYAGIYSKNLFRKYTGRIFKRVGFRDIGSCICFIPKGYCRGTLLEKQLTLELEKMQ